MDADGNPQADLHKLLERVPSLHLVAVAHEPVILPGRYKVRAW